MSQKDLNETEISHLPDKEFKIADIKILTEVRTMYKVRISTEIENIRKYHAEITELMNTTTELKNTIEGFQQQTK